MLWNLQLLLLGFPDGRDISGVENGQTVRAITSEECVIQGFFFVPS